MTLDLLFKGGKTPSCADVADGNDNGNIDISDLIYLLAWRFSGDPALAAPGPCSCGAEATADELECAETSCD